VDAIGLIYKIAGLDKLDDDLQDDKPQMFQLNIVVNTQDGQKRVITNLDSLEEIPLSEFKTITTVMNTPRVGIAEMEEMLQDAEEESDVE
jgi:hypothetical protein